MVESHMHDGDVNLAAEVQPAKAAGRFRTALPQVLASTAKNMLLLDLGMTVAFPTIVIPALHNTKDPLSLNDERTSWFGSVMYICQLLGSILSGIVLEHFGRKKSMILVNFPHVVGWFMFYFANSEPMLFVSCIIMGLGVGFMEAPIITYVGEISQPEMRGILTSYSGICVQLGFFLEYLLGTVSDWRTAAAISAVVPIATVIAITQVPETPIWLLSRCRVEEAEKALCWLRGWVPPSAVKREFDELVLYSENMKKSKNAPRTSSENSVALSTTTDVTSRKCVFCRKMRELLKPQTLRPLSVVLIFFLFQHSSGFTAMRPYMVQIFVELGLPLDAHWVTVLTAVVGLMGNVVCMVTVPWWGKRPLSLVSFAVASMAAFLLGSYVFAMISPGDVATGGTNQTFSWIPLALFVVYVLMQTTGVHPIPWMVLSEVFPFRSRGLASGVAAAGSYLLAFLFTKTFLSIKSTLSLYGSFWLYGCLGTVGFFVIYWIFPETEGRSLEDIEEFYKTRIRGKISKKADVEGTPQTFHLNFTPSVNSVGVNNGNKESTDEDVMVVKPDKNSRGGISGGIVGTSTETLHTTFTVSAASLQDRDSTTGDITEVKVDGDIKQQPGKNSDETEMVKEKYDKMKITNGETSNKTLDVEGNPSDSKTMGQQGEKAKAALVNNGDIESDMSAKERVVVHNGAGVEERTNM